MSEESVNMLALRSETLDAVDKRIKELENQGGIQFPANYAVGNALQSAWLKILDTVDLQKRPALEVCTKVSVQYALLNMVIQGLSVAKNQGYFIVYGNKLTFMRSYFGTMAVTKRLQTVEDIFAQVIYQDDEFEFVIERATKRVTRHEQKLENIDPAKIIGAYCTIIYGDGKEFTEIMTKTMINSAWSKTKTSGGTQKEFPEDMAKRTVINHTCKMFANTSDDSDILVGALNDTEEVFDEDRQVQSEINHSANGEILDMKAEPSEPNTYTPQPDQPKQKAQPETKATAETKKTTQAPTQQPVNEQKAGGQAQMDQKQATMAGPGW